MQARAIIGSTGEETASGVAIPVPWWSFTKTVLATALMRLSETGRIDIAAPIAGKRYSATQLLRHEAGVPDYGALPRYHADVEAGRPPWPIDTLLQAVQADRLRYEPGQGWAYSNIGYWEVAKQIERASDRPLGEALAELVFKRAGIVTARLATVPTDLASVCMGAAAGYDPGWVYHGLVVGTVLDAARVLRCLLAGKIVGRNHLATMLAGRALPQFRSEREPDPAYGMGLMLRATNPLDGPVGHSGRGPGSGIAVYGRRGITCAVWLGAPADGEPETEVLEKLGEQASSFERPQLPGGDRSRTPRQHS